MERKWNIEHADRPVKPRLRFQTETLPLRDIPELGEGRSIVVYHGTDEEFDAFDLDRFGGRRDDRHFNGALGVFLTPSEELATHYGQITLEITVPLDRCIVMDIGAFRKMTTWGSEFLDPDKDPLDSMRELRERLIGEGCDLLIIEESCGRWGMGVALDPSRLEVRRMPAPSCP